MLKKNQIELNGKEDFIQDYCNRGGILNSTPLKQKVEKILSISVSGNVLKDGSGETCD